MPNIIQLSGRKRSGKDWTATAVKHQPIKLELNI